MKKIFYLLFFTILIAKAFPDENEKDKKKFRLDIIPEIATIECGIDLIWGGGSSPYWKFDLFNINFAIYEYGKDDSENIYDIEITPAIILKDIDTPSYNFSFVNLKISYIFEYIPFFNIKPFLGINYLNLKEDIFDFNAINLQTGVRVGILPIWNIPLLYFETGYAYKNNSHNYYFSIGISSHWFLNVFLISRFS